MGTPTKKKKKRPPPTATPPKANQVITPPSSSSHTESGNATNYPATSRTPSSEISSPFNSAYVTPLITPTSIPFEFKRPSTAIITHSDIVITHQPSTTTQTTPTCTTVNTITTTVLIHTPPRTIMSPISTSNTPNTSTQQPRIPTSPKLTPIFPETITTPRVSPATHRCVGCGEAHEGQPCSAASCKCANCGKGHPSSYRGCQTYLAARARFLSIPHPESQNQQVIQTQTNEPKDKSTPPGHPPVTHPFKNPNLSLPQSLRQTPERKRLRLK